jgi:hypothetical protein
MRAMALAVELPPDYVDNPANDRVDGHDVAGVAASPGKAGAGASCLPFSGSATGRLGGLAAGSFPSTGHVGPWAPGGQVSAFVAALLAAAALLGSTHDSVISSESLHDA